LALRYAALATGFIVVVGGAAQAAVYSGDFSSVWNAIWWSLQTVTTVGYGDYP
jgi:hypothetical protein